MTKPQTHTLSADSYDQLLALTKWIEAMPMWLELGDRAWDQITDQQAKLVNWPDDKAVARATMWGQLVNEAIYVTSVQVEDETSVCGGQWGTEPGQLVAIVADDTRSDETHVLLIRGK